MSRVVSAGFKALVASAKSARSRVMGVIEARQEAVKAAQQAMNVAGYENSTLSSRLQNLRDWGDNSSRYADWLTAGDLEREKMQSEDPQVSADKNALYGAGGGADGTLEGLYAQQIEGAEEEILTQADQLKDDVRACKKEMPKEVRDALNLVLGVCNPLNQSRVMEWEEAHEKQTDLEKYEEAREKLDAAKSEKDAVDSRSSVVKEDKKKGL